MEMTTTRLARTIVFLCLALSPAVGHAVFEVTITVDNERVEGDLYAFDLSLSSTSDDTFFGTPIGIHHRNHLPVASAAPLANTDCIADYCADFTTRQSHQHALKDLGHGRLAMRAGDVNRSETISLTDRGFVVIHNGKDILSYAYRDPDANGNYIIDGDVNFSGAVSLADRGLIVVNSGWDICTFCSPNP